MQGPPTERTDGVDSEAISFLALLGIVMARRRVILYSLGVALLVGAATYLLLPRTYRAESVFVVSNQESEGPLANVNPGMAQLLGRGQGNQSRQLILALTGSESLADTLVRRILVAEPGADSARVRATIKNNTEFRPLANEFAYRTVVHSTDPERAALIANTIPAVINKLASQLSMEAASQRKAFLERQVAEALADLEAAEEQLVGFQTTHSAPALEEQSRRTIEAASRLQQEILAQELVVTQLRRSATADNPELQAAVAQLGAMRRQLRDLSTETGRGSGSLFLPLEESPELNLAATRVLREYGKSEKVHAALVTALADVQIEAREDLPIVSQLDRARVPLAPVSPNLARIFAIALFLGLGAGMVLVVVMEYLAQARLDARNQAFFHVVDRASWRLPSFRDDRDDGKRHSAAAP